MTRDNPRRPASRTPTSRPRRVAGQGTGRPDAPAEAALVEPVETPEAEAPDAPTVDVPESEVDVPEPEVDVPEPEVDVPEAVGADAPGSEPGSRRGLGGLFDSRRATAVLVSLALVLAIAAAGLFTYRAVTGDDSSPKAAPVAPEGQIVVPKGRPVLISNDDQQDAVAAAAKDAETILAASYKTFDSQVGDATKLMTTDFATKYRATKADIKEAFVAAQTEVQVRVVAQGVVAANRSQVQALLFLNQYVTKGGTKGTTYTPYRALVTVVHTDRGWLVSNIDTK